MPETKSLTLTEWQAQALAIHQRADRVRAMLLDRARQTAAKAGLDPTILGVHVHNALVSAEYGTPWRGVDYALVRKARWLMDDRAARPGRLAEAAIARLWRRVQFPPLPQ
jgi:hypothetical protein